MNIKRILLLLIILIALPLIVFSQESRQLEVDYPIDPTSDDIALSTVESTPVQIYVKYIINICFGIAGIISFLALIYAGFGYLTSTGNPGKMSESKKRIISVFLGLGILLFSYLLLITINPDLTTFDLPKLEEIILEGRPISPSPISTEMLGTVKEIGVLGKKALETVDNRSHEITSSLRRCRCLNANSLCLCEGGDENDRCLPQTCYVGRDSGGHPCGDYIDIKRNQELVVFWYNELVNYKNRSFSEIEGLEKDIEEVIQPQIDYYQELISIEISPLIIESLNFKLDQLQEERRLKESLINELYRFIYTVDALRPLIKEMSKLPNECAPNTLTQCEAQCLPVSECHDTYIGCKSLCFGLNPCPFIEANIVYAQISTASSQVISAADGIVSLVTQIRMNKKRIN